MAGITFQDYVTPIPASWLNTVNNTTYNGIFDGVNITAKGLAGTDRGTIYTTGTVKRWFAGTISDPEIGSNLGSTYAIFRYNDAGGYQGTAIAITRDTSVTSFSGDVISTPDNAKSLGNGASRWSVVYAGTGTINTSDAREKTPVRSLVEAEISAAKQLVREIGSFKFLSAVAEKGDEARSHIGMTVQRAMEILTSHGLVPTDYGFICYDEWEQQVETVPTDTEGQYTTRVIQEAGNRYSFRTDELLLFIARGLAAQLDSIEARLT